MHKTVSSKWAHGIGRQLADNMMHIGTGVGAAAIALAATDKLLQTGGDMSFKSKLPSLLSYAKAKHPELANVGNEQLRSWALAIYSMAPKIAKNKETLADTLYHIYQYGGRFDLSTLRLMAEVGAPGDSPLQTYITTASKVIR